ncbi:MAG: hypothetical protein ABIT01_00845 [Thermoanaerobaculia bacterium]
MATSARPSSTLFGWCTTTPTPVHRDGVPSHVEFRVLPSGLRGAAPRDRREQVVVVRGPLADSCLRLVRADRRVAVEGTLLAVDGPRGPELHASAVALVWPIAT